MPNPGIAPPDYDTNVGMFRLNTNDTTYVALDPPVSGQGDYTHSSDAEIEAFLAQGGDNVSRALGYYFQYLATQASLTEGSIKDFDLTVDQRGRYEALQAQADRWFDLADGEDGFSDIFDSFEFNTASRCTQIEGAPCPRYCEC